MKKWHPWIPILGLFIVGKYNSNYYNKETWGSRLNFYSSAVYQVLCIMALPIYYTLKTTTTII